MDERFDLIQKNGYGIIQNKKWFSYGIDAVLLSHFAEFNPDEVVVDLGTGNAIIPMLITLNHSLKKVYGVEKQALVADMAKRTVVKNQVENIEIIESDILHIFDHLKPGTMDVVTCNPPYFKRGGGIIGDLSIKATARHETTALAEDFIKAASKLLKTNGRFYMVHRPSRLVDLFYYLRKYNLEAKLIQFVHPNRDEVPNIVLIKCVKNGNSELKYKKNLYVYENNRYSDDIFEIYRTLNIDVF